MNIPIKEARKIKNHWRRKIKKLKIKIQNGDAAAALEIIETMTNFNRELNNSGWRITSEDESPPNRLISITKEWKSLQKTRKERNLELLNRISNGDLSVEFL